MAPEDISDPSHWGRHAVEPVNLPLALEAMLDAYALSLGGGDGGGGGGAGDPERREEEREERSGILMVVGWKQCF